MPEEVELNLAFPVRLCRFSRMFFFRILMLPPCQGISLYDSYTLSKSFLPFPKAMPKQNRVKQEVFFPPLRKK